MVLRWCQDAAAPVSESLVAIDPIMQARIQHRHELEGHDHAAIIKLLSYVQHLVIAKATASSTQSLMAANVVRGLQICRVYVHHHFR